MGSKEVLYEVMKKEDIDSVNISYYYLYFHLFKSHFKGSVPTYDKLEDLQKYKIADIIGSPLKPMFDAVKLNIDYALELDQGLDPTVSDPMHSLSDNQGS
jgi:hypothetical protein